MPTTDVGYGYLGGLMAFDIAAIQDKYGVNEDWATGDDTYAMKDVNAAGTYFTLDLGRRRARPIGYYGARDAMIDLRPATLQYEVGGGGRVSTPRHLRRLHDRQRRHDRGRTGGSGNDTLIGNDAANVLDGGAATTRSTAGAATTR